MLRSIVYWWILKYRNWPIDLFSDCSALPCFSRFLLQVWSLFRSHLNQNSSLTPKRKTSWSSGENLDALELKYTKASKTSQESKGKWVRAGLFASWVDVIALLDPGSLKCGRATPRARLWRAIENRGFNQIQKFFRRISVNGKWIHFSEKKFWGLGAL